MFVKHFTNEFKLIPHDLKSCIFTNVDKKKEIKFISSIYVNNSLISSFNENIKRIKKKIGYKFPMKNLGEVKHVVSM